MIFPAACLPHPSHAVSAAVHQAVCGAAPELLRWTKPHSRGLIFTHPKLKPLGFASVFVLRWPATAVIFLQESKVGLYCSTPALRAQCFVLLLGWCVAIVSVGLWFWHFNKQKIQGHIWLRWYHKFEFSFLHWSVVGNQPSSALKLFPSAVHRGTEHFSPKKWKVASRHFPPTTEGPKSETGSQNLFCFGS